MRKTLCGKLELVLVLLFCLFAVLQVSLMSWAMQAYLQEHAHDRSLAGPLRDSDTFRQAVLFSLLSLFALIWIGIRLFKRMTAQLKRLAAAMDTFQQKDFSEYTVVPQRFEQCRGDEVDRLCFIFNRMAEKTVEHVEALRKQDDLRRELISHVSHDLRTPLANLHGYLETLMMKGDPLNEEDRRRYVAIALHQSDRLRLLIHDLFELVKLDAGLIQPHHEPFHLNELVYDLLQPFQLEAREKHVRLEVECEPSLPRVRADIGMMERVLENLVKNAVRHTAAGGRITIRLTPAQEVVEVEVSDTGSGIAPEELPFIFDHYNGTSSRVRTSSEGTGLGLAITKRILELHHADITVHSVPGEGSTFRFAVPVCRP